jgi:hypothetical protein
MFWMNGRIQDYIQAHELPPLDFNKRFCFGQQ